MSILLFLEDIRRKSAFLNCKSTVLEYVCPPFWNIRRNIRSRDSSKAVPVLQVWEGGVVEYSAYYEDWVTHIMFEGSSRMWSYDLLGGL